MAVRYVVVPSGQAASSAFVLDRASRALAVFVPSHGAARAWYPEFSVQTPGVFARVPGPDGTWAPSGWAVFSGGGGPAFGIVPWVPSTLGRIVVVPGSVSVAMSVALVEILR